LNNIATDTDSILRGNASFNPALLVNFGNIATGATATEIVTVTNSGTAPLLISSATVNGNRFGKGSDSCTGQTIPVNGTCTVAVTFNPNNNTRRNGSLDLVHNGIGQTSVILTGR
ncbi:MAG: choice-of-anchor D domain-containing protein, partial [Gallionellaceae bacterium]|nr:choice-of-anchor D domain-containing protein [Gallionellaceae bacterium]